MELSKVRKSRYDFRKSGVFIKRLINFHGKDQTIIFPRINSVMEAIKRKICRTEKFSEKKITEGENGHIFLLL